MADTPTQIQPEIEPADLAALQEQDAAAGAGPTPPPTPPGPQAVDAAMASRALRFVHWGGWKAVRDGPPPELSPGVVENAGAGLAEVCASSPILAGWVRAAALANSREALLAMAVEEAELWRKHAPRDEQGQLKAGGVLGWLRGQIAGLRRRLGPPDGRGGTNAGAPAAGDDPGAASGA